MVFAALAAATLVLTLFGLGLVRVYDNQLVRQTESELIAQGVVLASAFRDASVRDGALPPCIAPTLPWPFPKPSDSALKPILPVLTASSTIEAPPHDPPASNSSPDPSMPLPLAHSVSVPQPPPLLVLVSLR